MVNLIIFLRNSAILNFKNLKPLCENRTFGTELGVLGNRHSYHDYYLKIINQTKGCCISSVFMYNYRAIDTGAVCGSKTENS